MASKMYIVNATTNKLNKHNQFLLEFWTTIHKMKYENVGYKR